MSNNENSPIESIAENLAALATGIPAPIQKNFFKALAQLGTALVDIPVAYLEDKAKITRALTESREGLIKKMGEDIGSNLNVPDIYADKAIEKFASKMVRYQINIDQIVQKAKFNLENEDSNAGEIDEISEDWLNNFEEIAKLKSNEEMQLLFGKILSGEISNPGAFSLKTLNTVSQMDPEVAKAFMKLCSCFLHFKSLDTVHLSVYPSALEHHLLDFEIITYYEITLLKEFGLLHSSPAAYNFIKIAERENINLQIGIDSFKLIFSGDDNLRKRNERNTPIINLTSAGQELISGLINEPIEPQLFAEIELFLTSLGFELQKR